MVFCILLLTTRPVRVREPRAAASVSATLSGAAWAGAAVSAPAAAACVAAGFALACALALTAFALAWAFGAALPVFAFVGLISLYLRHRRAASDATPS